MKKLDRCCCLSVRTGTLILASLGIATSCLSFVANLFALSTAPSRIITIRAKLQAYYAKNGQLEGDGLREVLEHYEKFSSAIYVVLGIGMALVVVNLLINALLLVGVRQRKSRAFLPWLLVTIFKLVLMGLSTVGGAIAVLVLTITMNGASGWFSGLIILVVGIPACILEFYLWLVVYSEYRNVKDESEADSDNPLCSKPVTYM